MVTRRRKVAAAKGLPPVTWDKTWGYCMLDDTPEVWIGYAPAFFESVHHRVANFIAGIVLPHPKKNPDDRYIRTVMAQLGSIESTVHLPLLHRRPRMGPPGSCPSRPARPRRAGPRRSGLACVSSTPSAISPTTGRSEVEANAVRRPAPSG